jgi:hypothetical protein
MEDGGARRGTPVSAVFTASRKHHVPTIARHDVAVLGEGGAGPLNILYVHQATACVFRPR